MCLAGGVLLVSVKLLPANLNLEFFLVPRPAQVLTEFSLLCSIYDKEKEQGKTS